MAERYKLTLDDLGLLLEELMVVCTQWYRLGLQLKVRPRTLEAIAAQFSHSRDQLLKMLKTWLTTGDNTSWKTLTDALRSQSVGVSQLADVLEAKYCLVEETEVHEKAQMSASREAQQIPLSLQGEGQMRYKLTLDDLGLLLEELMDVGEQGYHLGLQLNLSYETIERIHAHFNDPRDQLLEMLKVWLTTCDNTSWKTLTDALRSQAMGKDQLAGSLERKYCLTKDMHNRSILTLDDLDLLLEELLEVCEQWYPLGLQLKVRPGTLETITAQFHDPRDQLLEMLKSWLTTSDNTSWKTIIDALNSRSVSGYQIADYLKSKYCPMKAISETVQSPPGIANLSQDDSTLLEAQMSASREAQQIPLSLQGETQMSENPAVPISLKQILKDTKEVGNWFSLGIMLGIESSELKRIERKYFVDPDRCKTEVIDIWLDIDPEPTWNKLARAVEDVGRHAKVVETLRANHEGVLLINAVPMTTQDEDKSVAQVSVLTENQPIPTSLQGESQMMAKQAQGQVRYQTVQLIKTEPLGTGSYGAVYKAMCDNLLCAGKILHPTLFQSSDPGAMTIIKQFQQECSVLSAIRHPSIVQYLGSYQDLETQLPVLLMELMDDNLTRFLERSEGSLPYHVQVNISHDIVLALAYLHSNDIIHRDLSSNNVLMTGAGNRAKVTDFGMAKLFNINRATMTPLTMCPGTLPYMSPESLDDPPVYTKKLDTFSFGVLNIQIITRQFPDPGPRTKKIQDPHDPKRRLQEVVLETERRKSHIDLIDATHPLLPIATDCLSYNEEDRPSAQELCHRLAALKQLPQYGDSVQQAQERSRAATANKEDRERQLRELQRQQKQIKDLQQELQVRNGQVKEKDAVIATKVQQLEQVTQEKDRDIEARERQLRELNQKLTASEQVTAQFQQDLQQKEKMIQELQEERQHLRQELGKVLQQRIVTQKASVHGVEVAGEAEFTVSTKGSSFQWKGYGLRLHVSKDSLPPGMGECRINIKVSLSGQFQLPEGSDILSPIFWISAPCKFMKPVTLEIQHCALVEDEAALSNLSFVLTKCSQRDLPYTFKQLEGGVFTTHSMYGSIQLSHFSGVGVTGRKGSLRSYCAHVYHTKKMDYEWRYYFVIIPDLEAKNTVVREHYGHFAILEATLHVRFEHNEITLGISDDGLVTKEGWRIIPFTAPTIFREHVDQFKRGRVIPECQLVVQWERDDQTPVRLRHKVILNGAKPPFNFIHLILNPAGQAPPQQSGKLHSTPELGDLMNLVAAKVPEKWRQVGIGLGLDTTDIKRIEADVPAHKSTLCYVDVFDTWKNKGTTEYTWDTLLKALRTHIVGASKLASTIEGQLS